MTDYCVREISLEDCLPIRQKVLWPSLGIDECRVAHDEDGSHYGVYISERIVGSASVFKVENDFFQIRKFAILPEMQGRGAGSFLLMHILQQIKDISSLRVVLDARLTAIGFYEKHGFMKQGSVFSKKSQKYIRMHKMS
ncbi:GNAT family N-acetyltransferase [Swingsia samuiensis]|uniref:N-acetyltransferase n=1 Tax=Swingsia samuiensis TaxID=1293412 RepID=A0A4Y6UK13_9PROT|nr:GNAT family N-acetyltransferase [Swingsia samuiensis]QDH16731.1 N-acetyltransferase [Swingsia samuiensis]